jgi:hypothetical protein
MVTPRQEPRAKVTSVFSGSAVVARSAIPTMIFPGAAVG